MKFFDQVDKLQDRHVKMILAAAPAGALAFVPAIAKAAQDAFPPPVLQPPQNSTLTLGDLAVKIINWLLIIAGAAAVIFLIIGGIRYIVSAGNSDQIEKAKHTILYAVIGIIVVLVSYIIVNALNSAANKNAG